MRLTTRSMNSESIFALEKSRCEFTVFAFEGDRQASVSSEDRLYAKKGKPFTENERSPAPPPTIVIAPASEDAGRTLQAKAKPSVPKSAAREEPVEEEVYEPTVEDGAVYVVTMKNGEKLTGTLTRIDDKWKVATAEFGTVSVARRDVRFVVLEPTALRSRAVDEMREAQKAIHPNVP